MAIEIKHRISGAVLFTHEGANLRGANLEGANLEGAHAVADLGQPDGWQAFAYLRESTIRVQVGCKNFTLAEGRAHWAGKPDRREVLAALDYAEAVAKIRAWGTK